MLNNNKPFLHKLKPLTGNHLQWEGFCEMLDYWINQHQKKLEQAVEMNDVFKAQGAIAALRHLKYLKEEIDAKQQYVC